jgi:hypothetical protein
MVDCGKTTRRESETAAGAILVKMTPQKRRLIRAFETAMEVVCPFLPSPPRPTPICKMCLSETQRRNSTCNAIVARHPCEAGLALIDRSQFDGG